MRPSLACFSISICFGSSMCGTAVIVLWGLIGDAPLASKRTWLEPPIPGMMPGRDRPKLILAQDIDYPPYAYLGDADTDFDVIGIGHDFAHGLKEVCDIDVVTVQTPWSECWEGEQIGRALSAGEFHGCMTFTHLRG